jgi:hypothetical protein
MKVTIEIDCTPIEARQFFGFPNVEPLQTAMMAKLEKRMLEEAERFSPDALIKAWFASLAEPTEWAQTLFAGMTRQSGHK